jgi:phosphate transport system permease protein
LSQASIRKAKRRDKIARWLITLGGMAVIAGVIAILLLIVGVTLPLFRSPRGDAVLTCRLPKSLRPEDVLGLGVDMSMDRSRVTGFVWTSGGTVSLVDLHTGEVAGEEKAARPAGSGPAKLRQVEPLGAGHYSLVWSDGSTSLVEMAAVAPGRQGERRAPFVVRTLASVPAEKGLQPLQALIRRSEAGVTTRVALLPDGRISVVRQATTENMMGEEETSTRQTFLQEDLAAEIRVMTLDREGATLYAGTGDGRLARWQLNQKGEVANREVVRAFADKRAVTALALGLGDVSLAVGDAEGGLTTWFPVRADMTRKLRLIHRLRDHEGAIRQILPSGRNKALLSLSDDGSVHLDHMTSERHLLSIGSEQPIRQMAFGPRGDVLLGLDAAGMLTVWHIDGGHPEVSLKTLFGKVLYEGYDEPAYVWQTTGGEDFEPKLSLVPLVFGTLKGTLYAMFFAVPLALFGAAYASHFTTPGFRRAIKPVVEIMAAVPSVVIGFLIALWLAPIVERWILAFFAGLATVPAAFLVFMVLWQVLRRYDWLRRLENGYEFLVLLPVLAAGVAAAVWLAGPLEAALFGGNFKLWLFEGPLKMRYDQRNNIIIAFGLGFTVIPIIFSIAEDSLSNVPYSMTAASMALGASRWQTLWRVVLPSASPGIFAAVMIGFGRAVGETMIVLMATGNTPILDWSPLNGMRTLSANVAVEIPEAPVGGTLYRVLFLCAVLLFALTFTVNTAAELVRQHLRKRYGQF